MLFLFNVSRKTHWLAALAWLAWYAPFVIPHVAQEHWIGVAQ